MFGTRLSDLPSMSLWFDVYLRRQSGCLPTLDCQTPACSTAGPRCPHPRFDPFQWWQEPFRIRDNHIESFANLAVLSKKLGRPRGRFRKGFVRKTKSGHFMEVLGLSEVFQKQFETSLVHGESRRPRVSGEARGIPTVFAQRGVAQAVDLVESRARDIALFKEDYVPFGILRPAEFQ